jgi:hypothetical protein
VDSPFQKQFQSEIRLHRKFAWSSRFPNFGTIHSLLGYECQSQFHGRSQSAILSKVRNDNSFQLHRLTMIRKDFWIPITRNAGSTGKYTIYGPITFVMLTINKANSSSSTQHIPKFSLNVESVGEKSTSYSNHIFSHYDYTISNGSIQYPERTGSDLGRKYGPNEIVTFTVNTFPIIEKPLRVNITRLDLESSTKCSYDSVTFVEPASSQTPSLQIRGIPSSDYRWVIFSEKQLSCRVIYFKCSL